MRGSVLITIKDVFSEKQVESKFPMRHRPPDEHDRAGDVQRQ